MPRKIALRRAASMLLAGLTLCLAGLLIVQCLSLYRSEAPQPYTSASIAAALSPLALPFGLWCLALLLCLLLPGEHADKGAARFAPKAVRASHGPLVRTLLLLAGATLLALGILEGGWRDVLVKAINICTECIGLG